MADTKLSALTEVTSLTAADEIYVNDGGTSKRITWTNFEGTFITPALGTPASGVMTNVTGTAASLTAGLVSSIGNLTGHITSVNRAAVLGSFTLAQLNTAISDDSAIMAGGTIPLTANWDVGAFDITCLTMNVDGDTSAGDIAAMGYTATEGLILTGQGSTNDVTIKNDADATVLSILTGTTEVDITGSLDVIHTAANDDDHAVEIELDCAGFGGVSALDVDFITGAIATGDDVTSLLTNIDQISAAGGTITGHAVLATDGSADNIYGQKAGAGVGPILQDSGTFANPTTGTNDTTATDVAAMIDGSTGTSTTIFVADDDYILIGAAAAFTEIEFVIQTGAGNPGVTPTFGYSITGAHQFTTFAPIDGTNGFRNTGVVAWDAADLTSHTTNDDTGTFDIKITRTNNTKGNVSLYYAKTAATVVYSWDKDGVVSVAQSVFAERADHAETPAATYGQLWVRNDAPNVLVFTDDAGTDTDLGGSGGFGADVNTQITPSTAIVLDQATGDEDALRIDYQTNKATSGDDSGIVVNLTDTASPGVSLLQDWQVGGVSQANIDNAGKLTLDPAGGFGNTTGVWFGDGDSGIYEFSDDALAFQTSGTDRFYINTTYLRSAVTGGASLRNAVASSVQPTLIPRENDANSGVGSAAADQLSLIAGGVEGIRLSEVSSHIIQQHELQAGITANTNSSQGDTPLLSSYNEISVCANAGDAVTLPTAAAGIKITIINNGAQAADIFPASSDNLGAGADTAVSLAAGSNITYIAYDATNWESI